MNIEYSTLPVDGATPLMRRGFSHGWVKSVQPQAMPAPADARDAWQRRQPIFLPAILADSLPAFHADIAQASDLMERIRQGAEFSELLDAEAYQARLNPAFELSGASFEDNDPQAIEKLIFDAWEDGEIVADNLWCKASWLSFDDEDGSLRFRFSFGFEGYEDVAADPVRQAWAAKLTDAIFPESASVTQNQRLNALLRAVLACEDIGFMERIVYFNAPNGGAQMHHDVERGHAGVVFAQLSGSTFWLALSKPRLLDAMTAYLERSESGQWPELKRLAINREALAEYLEKPDHELAEALMDRDEAFTRHLLEQGHAFVLQPGDAILLPQESLDDCVWHSVFCLGDVTGEGLSFALKRQ